MIIKATLVTLVVILVVVIATSYYVNKEGFDDISNNLGSALNTVTPDTSVLDTTQLLVAKPLLTTPPPRLSTGMSGSGRVGSGMSSSGTVGSGMSSSGTVGSGMSSSGTVGNGMSSSGIVPIIIPNDIAIKERLEALGGYVRGLNMTGRYPDAPSCKCSSEDTDPKMAYNFDKLHEIAKQDINYIAKSINDVESSSTPVSPTELLKVVDNAGQKLRVIMNNLSPRQILPFKFNDPDNNLLFRDTVRNITYDIDKILRAYGYQSQINEILADTNTPENKTTALNMLSSIKESLKSLVNTMNNSINKLNAIKFVEPNTSATSTTTSRTTPPGAATLAAATTGSSPTRTDVVPQVSFSDNGYNALMLQQKADLLKDIQKVVRNEVLANRSTTPMLHNDNYDGCEAENGHKDGCEPVKEHGCDTEDVPKNECDTKSAKDKVTAAISQGKEYENSCYKDKKSKASCPPPPDMAQFIKKDAIPCWGCNLDY